MKTSVDYFSRLIVFGLLILLKSTVPTHGAEDIDMSKVRALAALSVREILGDSPVTELSRPSYWKTIRESRVPVVVMFYSNVDSESQRLATLVRYVSIRYKGKLAFYRVMVAAKDVLKADRTSDAAGALAKERRPAPAGVTATAGAWWWDAAE